MFSRNLKTLFPGFPSRVLCACKDKLNVDIREFNLEVHGLIYL